MAAQLETSFYAPSVAIATAHRLVKVTSGALVVTAADTDLAYGIMPDAGVAGVKAGVVFCGEAYAIAGGTIAVDAVLAPDAAGAVKTAQTGDKIVGRAIEAAAAGDKFLMHLYLNKTIASA